MSIKKILKWFLVVFLTLVGLLVLLIANFIFRFDVYVYPINAHISQNVVKWGDSVDLVPEIFEVGDSYEDVISGLSFAGYAALPPEDVRQRHEAYHDPHSYVFIRDASTLVCNVKLYAFLKFDENMKLKKAIGTQREQGCL